MTGEDRAFEWPPKPEEPAAAIPNSPDETPAELHSPVREAWWRRVERTWLEPTRLPLRARAERVGWIPDAYEAYCARCGHDVGPHEESEFGCSTCANTRPRWSRVVRLGTYAEPLSSWVQEVKFERGWRLGEALGMRLGEQLLEAGLELGEAVIVPMPSTWRRRMARGTDHALTISRGVAKATGCPLVRALRRKHTVSQRAVKPGERASNVSGVFEVRQKALLRLSGRPLVLIDDVMTSGATMRSACRVLRAGVKGEGDTGLWVGVIAVTPPAGSSSGPGSRRREEGFSDEACGRAREDGDFLQASS